MFSQPPYICDDGEVRDHVEDLEPDADVLGSLGHGPPRLANELLRVQPDLDPVVEQREEGGQGEGRHEDGDEAELQNWKVKRTIRPENLGGGGGLVVNVLAFYSNDPSSNPAGYVYLNLLYKKGIK